jgi:hypothetical protein
VVQQDDSSDPHGCSQIPGNNVAGRMNAQINARESNGDDQDGGGKTKSGSSRAVAACGR